jgi:hypothetical protein
LAEIIEAIKKSESQGGGSDKRRHARIAVVTRVELLDPATGQSYAALTRDVSLAGIGLMQSSKMEKGTRRAIALPRGKEGAMVVLCEVAHARELAEGIWGAGATFLSAKVINAAPAKDEAAEAERIASRMLD